MLDARERGRAVSSQNELHRWWLTPTALFRSHAPPVFLTPRHWLSGCWTCAARSPHEQGLLEQEANRRERECTRRFKFPPGPSVGDLRDDMAWAHPCCEGGFEAAPPHRYHPPGSEAAYIEARERWIIAGNIGIPTRDELRTDSRTTHDQ
jgi:hypothetical protein